MKRKITLFALGAKWGSFAASGLAQAVAPSAARVWLAKNPPSRSPERASPVNDAPASQKNSRRVRRQKPARESW